MRIWNTSSAFLIDATIENNSDDGVEFKLGDLSMGGTVSGNGDTASRSPRPV